MKPLHTKKYLFTILFAWLLGMIFPQLSASAQDNPADMLIPGNGCSPFNSNRRWLTTPVYKLDDGRLVTLVDNGLVFSSDNMASWSEPLIILSGDNMRNHKGSKPSGGGTLHIASGGTWVVAWRDDRKPDTLEAYWDKKTNSPVKWATGAIWATYSENQGQTWSAPVKVLDKPGGYPPKQIFETREGTLVMPVQYHASMPGRNVIIVLRSTDQGKTWLASGDEIDVGGCGHHDGALEPTLMQLNDGRVWLVFRTTRNTLWQSFSSDEGKTWTAPSSTKIVSSSSPPYIGRLKDGRILLLWNMLRPSDGSAPPALRGGDKFFSLRPTSWYRQELMAATSSDEGKTWNRALIIARHPKKSGRLAYPYFFEDDNGNVLIFANQGKIEASIPASGL